MILFYNQEVEDVKALTSTLNNIFFRGRYEVEVAVA